jgi:hypothetical protein
MENMAVGDAPKEKGAWVVFLTRVILVISVVLSVLCWLGPYWYNSEWLNDVFGVEWATLDALLLLILLMFVLPLLDFAALVLSGALLRKPRRRPNLILGVVALVVTVASLVQLITPYIVFG